MPKTLIYTLTLTILTLSSVLGQKIETVSIDDTYQVSLANNLQREVNGKNIIIIAKDSVAEILVKRNELINIDNDSTMLYGYSDGYIAYSKFKEALSIELDIYREFNSIHIRTLLISFSNGTIASWNFFMSPKHVYVIEIDFLVHLDYLEYSDSILSTIRRK